MSAGPYTYDLDELGRVARGLRLIASDYDSSGDDYAEVAGALSSSQVRDALDDFIDNWKKKRAKQTTMLTSASEALDRIMDGYRDNDDGAAQALRSGQ